MEQSNNYTSSTLERACGKRLFLLFEAKLSDFDIECGQILIPDKIARDYFFDMEGKPVFVKDLGPANKPVDLPLLRFSYDTIWQYPARKVFVGVDAYFQAHTLRRSDIVYVRVPHGGEKGPEYYISFTRGTETGGAVPGAVHHELESHHSFAAETSTSTESDIFSNLGSLVPLDDLPAVDVSGIPYDFQSKASPEVDLFFSELENIDELPTFESLFEHWEGPDQLSASDFNVSGINEPLAN